MKLFVCLFIILIILVGCSAPRTASRAEVEKMLKVQEAESKKPDDIRMQNGR